VPLLGKAILGQQKQIASRLLHQSKFRAPVFKPFYWVVFGWKFGE